MGKRIGLHFVLFILFFMSSKIVFGGDEYSYIDRRLDLQTLEYIFDQMTNDRSRHLANFKYHPVQNRKQGELLRHLALTIKALKERKLTEIPFDERFNLKMPFGVRGLQMSGGVILAGGAFMMAEHAPFPEIRFVGSLGFLAFSAYCTKEFLLGLLEAATFGTVRTIFDKDCLFQEPWKFPELGSILNYIADLEEKLIFTPSQNLEEAYKYKKKIREIEIHLDAEGRDYDVDVEVEEPA